MHTTPTQNKTSSGFTIVELLIVIVVIAILAAIGIVAYTGVQGRAHDSAVQQDLRQIGQRLELYRAEHGYYPTPDNGANMASLGLRVSTNSYSERGMNPNNQHNLVYCHPSDGQGIMALVAAASSENIWQYHNGTVSEYSGRSGAGTNANIFCPDVGVSLPAATAAHRTFFRNGENWASWLRG